MLYSYFWIRLVREYIEPTRLMPKVGKPYFNPINLKNMNTKSYVNC